jgi:hypothetical protein
MKLENFDFYIYPPEKFVRRRWEREKKKEAIGTGIWLEKIKILTNNTKNLFFLMKLKSAFLFIIR